MIDVLAKKLNIHHVSFSPANLQRISDYDEHNLVKQSGLIMYTSGTTGRPKGVVHTHESINMQVNAFKKVHLYYICGITPKHVTSGGAHL